MKLASALRLEDAQRRRLRAIAPALEILESDSIEAEIVAQVLRPDTEILYAFHVPVDLLQRAPSLRWLQLLSAGCDQVPSAVLGEPSLRITTVSGIHAVPGAEHVLAVILGLHRLLPQTMRAQLNHRWIDEDHFMREAGELRGRTVGIVGYGSIGREVARLTHAFGARVLAVKREANIPDDMGYTPPGLGDPSGSIPLAIFPPTALLEVLPQCDVVVLMVPLTEQTRGLIGRRELGAMKPESYLVDISRGEVVDEAALIEVLSNGRLAGAALDVFEEEPLPPHSELWDLENVFITPHVAGASRYHDRRAFEILAENLRRYLADDQLLNLVNRERGY